MPSNVPTWRIDAVIAPEMPAWMKGIPDVAVLVLGGFPKPMPMPIRLEARRSKDDEGRAGCPRVWTDLQKS